jgi:hypothetical protein
MALFSISYFSFLCCVPATSHVPKHPFTYQIFIEKLLFASFQGADKTLVKKKEKKNMIL